MNKRLLLVLASLTLIVIGLCLGRAYRDRTARGDSPSTLNTSFKGSAGRGVSGTAVVTNVQMRQGTTPSLGPRAGTASAAVRPPQKRAWDYSFLPSLNGASQGDAVRFELVNGEFASGTLRYLERRGGNLWYVAGQLTSPESGR